jgi:putative DNA primase/helicase
MNQQFETPVVPAAPFQTQKIFKQKNDPDATEKENLARLNARIAALNSPKIEHEKQRLFKELPPENDAGNARLFIDRFGDDLHFIPAFDSWLVWSGIRWKRDEDGEIQRLAVKLSQLMLADAAQIADHNQRAATAERSIRLGNLAKINSMLEIAKCDKRVVVPHSKLDANAWLLGVENGVIDLQAGIFRRGAKEDFITKMAGCPYAAQAEAPRWLQFLREIFPDDAQLIAYVQKLVGYTLTGSTREQMFPFLHGDGANGKTTFIETLTALAGDYGQRASQALLVACDNGREPMNEIARLRGARLVVGSETREGDRLAENRIKDMTGGDTLTGRFLYREAFDFIPTLKLWMFGNHRPQIRGTDHGIWRRVRLIPFNVQIADNKRDGSLQSKLREELPGILNWAIRGCLLWQREGLASPYRVTAATGQYREDEDVLGDFLTEETETDNKHRVYHAELYDRYTSWCSQNGVRHPMQSRTLSKRLRERGCYQHERTGTGIRWAGIQLK